MENKIFILTDPERGWDCVVGAFTTRDLAELAASKQAEFDGGLNWEDYMIIHEVVLEDN